MEVHVHSIAERAGRWLAPRASRTDSKANHRLLARQDRDLTANQMGRLGHTDGQTRRPVNKRSHASHHPYHGPNERTTADTTASSWPLRQAVLYFTGEKWGHTELIFWDQVTQTDADAGALQPALSPSSTYAQSLATQATHTLSQGLRPPSDCILTLGATLRNISPLNMHFNPLTSHPGLSLSIQHAKRDPDLLGIKRTRHLTLEAAKAPLRNARSLESIHV